MKYIKKIKLMNFKRFKSLELEFDDNMNLLVGDNESGKSTILQAIDFVISGSRTKVESYGLEQLFNASVIEEFLNGSKQYEDLPKLFIEVYLNEQANFRLNGQVNSDENVCDGLRMYCEPDVDLGEEIVELLNQDEVSFPFEYYKIGFATFSGQGYTGYRKFLKKIIIDSTTMNSEYAAREYIKDVYSKNVTVKERAKHQNEYRKAKSTFSNGVLDELNTRIDQYSFSLKTDSRSNLHNDLSINEGNISIENMGKGRQCFIKTEFALKNSGPENDIDILLLEEPENHLSHVNMNKLVKKIVEAHTKQKFITTHSNMICTRLDLRKAIMLNSMNDSIMKLNQLSDDTAKFFMKAPDNNVLEYILSKKVILVEGDAEYILIESFFKKVTGMELSMSDIHVLSVGGTSFKRYLDISQILNIKTAVIRDNDGDYQSNCIDNYSSYDTPYIKIFSEENNEISTFEISLFTLNEGICNELFSEGRRSLSVQEYMLKNKAEAAFELLDKKFGEITVPNYIREAIEWLRE